MGGESGQVSVPTLNRRIGHVHVGDGVIGEGGVVPVQLGDGAVGVKGVLERLRGVGFGGYLSVNRVVGEPEAFLGEAVRRVREWTRPRAEGKKAIGAKAAAVAKPVASKGSDAAPGNAAVVTKPG
jgi:hypothetical protein